MVKRAIVIGAGGLVGNELIKVLLASAGSEEVVVLVRKELPIKHHKLTQLLVDFNRLDDYSGAIKGDAAFCCLGSTRKKTPDLNEYRKIDHDYPLQLALIALGNNVNQYHLVSAIGADAGSSNFYNKMKGETEQDIIKAGLPALHIYRPSLLTGKRKESRPMEVFFAALMKVVDPLLFGSPKKYRSIAAVTVAKAMYNQSIKNEVGVHIYPSDKIKELA